MQFSLGFCWKGVSMDTLDTPLDSDTPLDLPLRSSVYPTYVSCVHATDGTGIELTMTNLWKLPVTCYSKGKKIKIISESASSYYKIGSYLLNDAIGDVVKSLEKADPTDTLCDIFRKWLREYPERSWGKLSQVLWPIGSLAETALNLQPQPYMPFI